MSNGLTSVFISVMSLATSALAQTDRQRAIAVWLASHDQGVFGLGLVGFDIGQMPWDPESFEADRDFVLRAVDAARARTGWDRLDYEPKEDWLMDRLERFRCLVEAFVIGDADAASRWPFDGPPAEFTLCPEHAVYCHAAGCVVCND